MQIQNIANQSNNWQSIGSGHGVKCRKMFFPVNSKPGTFSHTQYERSNSGSLECKTMNHHLNLSCLTISSRLNSGFDHMGPKG